jgi:hypothetical protein
MRPDRIKLDAIAEFGLFLCGSEYWPRNVSCECDKDDSVSVGGGDILEYLGDY